MSSTSFVVGDSSRSRRVRVGVVGGGAAGTSAAWSFSRFPDQFEVDLFESNAVLGGVAMSMPFSPEESESQPDAEDGHAIEASAIRINHGVQGGSKAYQNTLQFHRLFGFETEPVHMTVSFGKGEHNWTNHTPKPLQEHFRSEISRFGRLLWWIHKLECITIFLSIDFILRLFCYSQDFRNRMVYPLVALFFGTGNQTPKVSSAVIARVFLDPDMRLFDYDSEYLLHQTPEMFAFHDLESIYEKIRFDISGTHCRIHTSCPVTSVERRDDQGGIVIVTDILGNVYEFDRIIFACPANVALRLLRDPTQAETSILSSVQYFHDITITHTDRSYMEKHYDVHEGDMYLIKTYEDEPSLLEMGFVLTNYQPDLLPLRERGTEVYQAIFLDRKNVEKKWTIDEIDRSSILAESPWEQFSHTWEHFWRVVPWVWRLQGTRGNTYYAGSWTLFNTHDIAVCSGLACADRLGAKYPFPENSLACKTFDTYIQLVHRAKRSNDPSCFVPIWAKILGAVGLVGVVVAGITCAALFA